MFEKLGRFEIKGLLGRGAMGEVYLGLDPALGRAVAVKTIHAAALPAVIALARQHGIPRARLMRNMRFKMVMQNDRLNHRIPGGTGGDE